MLHNCHISITCKKDANTSNVKDFFVSFIFYFDYKRQLIQLFLLNGL